MVAISWKEKVACYVPKSVALHRCVWVGGWMDGWMDGLGWQRLKDKARQDKCGREEA